MGVVRVMANYFSTFLSVLLFLMTVLFDLQSSSVISRCTPPKALAGTWSFACFWLLFRQQCLLAFSRLVVEYLLQLERGPFIV